MSDSTASLEQELGDLLEVESFDPPQEFVEQALITDMSVHEEAAKDPVGWWAEQARQLDWFTEPTKALDDSDPPFFKWFEDGTLNASHNCLDRHVAAGLGDRVAFHWRGEEGEERDVTYAELLEQTQRFANALKDRGIAKGDVVGIFLPMIPEVVVAMLACARIGAPHNVVFGGFSVESVKERMAFSDAKALVTVDGARRKGKTAPIKQQVDEVMGEVSSLETIFVVRHTGADCEMDDGRDVWWHEAVEAADAECEAEPLEAEHPLYILYSSGSTAKPKGILHTTGGYLTGVAWTHKHVFDLKPESDVFWCSADVGWVTGHSYIVYGPLLNAATSVMYEGAPDYPDKDVWWDALRALRRHALLHRADGDPRVHQVGRRVPRAPRPVEAAPARVGRRADQPQGVALVLQGHRRRALPDRRHVVADRDRPHHDHDAPGRAEDEARVRGHAAARHRRRRPRRGGQRGRARHAGAARAAPAVAGNPAHAVPRRRPLHRDLLVEVGQATPTSSATRPSRTPTTTSGSSGASTTCSTSPATACRRPRSSRRSSRTPRSPRRR